MNRYYLGISPARLSHYYSNVSLASKLFACNTMHLFSEDFTTSDHRSTATYRLLSAVCDRPPIRTNVDHHLAISRFLLGHGLANRLAIPRTTLKRRARLAIARGIDQSLVTFGRWYTPRWEIERVAITRMLLLMIICWHLGVKRTKFTIKAFGDDMGHAERTDATAEKEKGEEKGEVEDVDKEELDPEVKMGPVAGKAIIGRWKWLIGEMVGVLVGGSVVVGVGSWFLYTTTFR
jgi:hypothetical protein